MLLAMVKPWWRFVPSSGTAGPSINLQQRLGKIDKSIDWNRFDKYLRWLDPRGEHTAGYPPIMLFKALLIQQWYALLAAEYEHCLADSLSCRRFVGLRGRQTPPSHETVASFRRLLVERGMALEVYAELDRQLEALHLTDLAGHASGPAEGYEAFPEPAPLRITQLLGPPEWTEIENSLLDYWEKMRVDRRMPRLKDVKLSEISEFQPSAILLRVIRDSNDFRYEFVGPKVVEGNDGDPTGKTISEKQQNNLRNYGHRGLQSELAATYAGAVKRRRPVSTSTYFVNATLKKCEIWVTVAPLAGTDDGEVEMLLGVALIKPILLN